MNPDLSFPEALAHLMNGVRMSTKFLPDTIFIELQTADANSMNTEPYLKMVQVEEIETENTKTTTIIKCEPWEPGRRSIFSNEWYTSKYQGMSLS